MVLRSLGALFTLLCRNTVMLARDTKHIHAIGLQKKKKNVPMKLSHELALDTDPCQKYQ